MNNVPNKERLQNWNELAKAEIAKMPSLAGKPPRTMFHLDTVVMADLKGCGMHVRQSEPILDDGFDGLVFQGPISKGDL